jgi:hypothetical protein
MGKQHWTAVAAFALVAAFAGATAPAATAPSYTALPDLDANNASILVATVTVKTSGLTDQQKAKLKPRLKLANRKKGVVVLYAYYRIGSKPKFRLLVAGLRGKDPGGSPKLTAADMAQMNMQFLPKGSTQPKYSFSGMNTQANVVGTANGKIVSAGAEISFSFEKIGVVKRAGGVLRSGAPSVETSARAVYHEARDESYDGQDEFRAALGDCCEDK